MNRLAALRVAGAVLLACILLAGCTGKPPVISRVYARVIYVEDEDKAVKTETLGVFLVATDPDGVENLSAFYVINDDAELFWKVDSSSWVSTTAEGETWIGTTSIDMPGSAELPAGQYRVVLQNVGGDTVEDSFTVPERTVSAAKASYPSAAIVAEAIKITGSYPGYEVWAYGKDGKFIATFPTGGKLPPLSLRLITASTPALAGGFTFRVYAWDAQGGYGVLSRPYVSESLPPR